MKRKIFFTFAVFLIFVSCNNKSKILKTENSKNQISNINEKENYYTQDIENNETVNFYNNNFKNQEVLNTATNNINDKKDNIDLDFTKMNYNMASSIMFDMMVESEKYINKRVKIDGQFDTDIHEGRRYYAVINWDLTGCCPTGLDFIPPDSFIYPYDFPPNDSFITVTGTLKSVPDEEGYEIQFFAESIIPLQ